MRHPTVAVIGAGFSGSLLALHLQANCPAGTRICLIERSGRFGPGLAHATFQPDHLLNVSAARMSALPDQPLHFLDWLHRQPEHILLGWTPSEEAFVPRRLYGAYISSLLRQGLPGGQGNPQGNLQRNPQRNPLYCLHEQANVITEAPDGVNLRFASGATLHADMLALATGNGPTLPPHPDAPTLQQAGLWHADPWSPQAVESLDPAAGVLIVGTGLTMVDLVLELLRCGHTGPITALSRNGRLPATHLPASAKPWPLPTPLPNDLGALVHTIRREIARANAAGQSWHGVIDALRPFTQDLWRGLSPAEQRRFLRHLRCWWDTHRHRMPPVSAERLAAARARGQFRVVAGRIEAARAVNGRAEVRYRRRGDGAPQTLFADRVITCTGPCSDVTRHQDPLIQSLLRSGLARPDALRLGLDVSPEAALIARDGTASRRLFALGPMTKGMWWEITAVPNIREQCRDVAATIAERCGAMVMDPVGLGAAGWDQARLTR